ncbi:MAG: ATP synthase F0 subunit C [Candidatus Margulisiibacteriota bacterium]
MELVGIASIVSGTLCMALGSIGSALGEGYICSRALEGLKRQPAAGAKVTRTMLIGQAITETPVIFAMVIALLLIFSSHDGGIDRAVSLLAAGLAMGIGAIGPGLAIGLPASIACEGISRQPDNTDRLSMNMLVGQAIAETGSIFAFTTALMCITIPTSGSFSEMVARLSAALCIGFGILGPAIGVGTVALKANKTIGKYPRHADALTRTMLIGQAVTETMGIYAMVVALVLIFSV